MAFVIVLLLIEFLDEFLFGAVGASWPLIRTDLALNYLQIGLLLTLPEILANFIEPAIGILGDVWKRRILILGGGISFGLACLLTAISHSFWPLMISFILFYPSSGAFVSLSQATLMDTEPTRHDHNMARWTFAGSLGVVVGPLALGAALWIGQSWRILFFLFAAFALMLVVIASRFHFPNGASHAAEDEDERPQSFMEGVKGAFRALKRREVLRWLVLLEFMDLLLDVLYGYLALYLVDVAHVTPAQAGIGVAVWSGFGLLGDFLLISLLERVDGVAYLRISAILEGVLYPFFLLVPGLLPKLVILALLGMFNAGWYAVLQGRLYSSMPGQSGTVTTVSNLSGLLGSALPLALGLIAERYGIGVAMWLLIAGPIALIIGLPRHTK
jgi:MFS transporter, FSR family, fosmidomycin resistance protein